MKVCALILYSKVSLYWTFYTCICAKIYNYNIESLRKNMDLRISTTTKGSVRTTHSLLYLLHQVLVSISCLEPASVAQLDAPSDWKPGGRGFNPRRGRRHSFVEIDHEIFSTVILSLPLIQEGQLSVSGERMCTILVNRLED